VDLALEDRGEVAAAAAQGLGQLVHDLVAGALPQGLEVGLRQRRGLLEAVARRLQQPLVRQRPQPEEHQLS